MIGFVVRPVEAVACLFYLLCVTPCDCHQVGASIATFKRNRHQTHHITDQNRGAASKSQQPCDRRKSRKDTLTFAQHDVAVTQGRIGHHRTVETGWKRLERHQFVKCNRLCPNLNYVCKNKGKRTEGHKANTRRSWLQQPCHALRQGDAGCNGKDVNQCAAQQQKASKQDLDAHGGCAVPFVYIVAKGWNLWSKQLNTWERR